MKKWIPFALVLTLCSTANAEDTEQPAQEQPVEAAEQQAEPAATAAQRSQVEEAAEAACRRAYDCAVENVPRPMRRMIDRDDICRVYTEFQDSDEEATVSAECVDAALTYLRCVRDSSCDDLTGRRAQPCVDQAESAQRICDDDE